jgi:hypothetical protein
LASVIVGSGSASGGDDGGILTRVQAQGKSKKKANGKGRHLLSVAKKRSRVAVGPSPPLDCNGRPATQQSVLVPVVTLASPSRAVAAVSSSASAAAAPSTSSVGSYVSTVLPPPLPVDPTAGANTPHRVNQLTEDVGYTLTGDVGYTFGATVGFDEDIEHEFKAMAAGITSHRFGNTGDITKNVIGFLNSEQGGTMYVCRWLVGRLASRTFWTIDSVLFASVQCAG